MNILKTLIVAVLCIVLLIVLVYFVKPAWLKYERKVFTSSHQYIEASQSKILNINAEIKEIEAEIIKYEIAQLETGKDYSKLIASNQNHLSALNAQIDKETSKLSQKDNPRR